MKKVILNKNYNGFNVSDEAHELYAKKKGFKLYKYKQILIDLVDMISLKKIRIKKVKGTPNEELNEVEGIFTLYFTKNFGDEAIISNENFNLYRLYLTEQYREDPVLIEVVEELGKKASGRFSNLTVVEIPDDLDYVIDRDSGMETLHQKVQEW